MRIVVISDSHKRTAVIDKILSSQGAASHVFFLGDNAADIEDFEYFYPNMKFHTVCGNCDYNSFLPAVGTELIDGVKILYTHGHTYGVKHGTERLEAAARQNNCQIALYGHTHISKTVYEDGLWIVNPGSCSSPREGRASYAVIDITPGGIMPIIIEI